MSATDMSAADLLDAHAAALDAHAHALAVVAAGYRVAATLLRADATAAADQVFAEVAAIVGGRAGVAAYPDAVLDPAASAAVREQLATLRRAPDAPVVVRIERRDVEHHLLAPIVRRTRPPKDSA